MDEENRDVGEELDGSERLLRTFEEEIAEIATDDLAMEIVPDSPHLHDPDAEEPAIEKLSENEGLDTGARVRDQRLIDSLPVDTTALADLWEILKTENVPIQVLSLTIRRDPVLALEVLKYANSLDFQKDRPEITNLHRAAVRLGAKRMAYKVAELGKHRPALPPEIFPTYAVLRKTAYTASRVTETITRFAQPKLTDEAALAGLVADIGLCAACVKFGEDYVRLASQCSRATLIYKLRQHFNFNPLSYSRALFRHYSVPHIIIVANDSRIDCRRAHELFLRLAIEATRELISAFERDRLSRYSSFESLPVGSTLRLLRIGSSAYPKLYEELFGIFWEHRRELQHLRKETQKERARTPSPEETPGASTEQKR